MFLDIFLNEKNWQEFSKIRAENIFANENIWPYIIGGIFHLYRLPMLIVTSTLEKNNELIEDFDCILKDVEYFNYYPFNENIFLKNQLVNSEIIASRIKVLKKIENYKDEKKPFIVLASVSSLINLMPQDVSKFFHKLSFQKSSEYERDEILKVLSDFGYERVNKVYDKGEFSVKGDIIDIFDVSLSNPLRVDFFDNMVQKMILYDANSQERISEIDKFDISPNINPWEIYNKDETNFNNIQSKNSLISIIDFLKINIKDFCLLICDPLEVYLKIKSERDLIEKLLISHRKDLISEDVDLIKRFIVEKDFLDKETSDLKFNIFSGRPPISEPDMFEFSEIKSQQQNFGNPGAFIENLKSDVKENKTILVSTNNLNRNKKISELLAESSIPFLFIKSKQKETKVIFNFKKGVVNFLNLKLLRGYESKGYSIYGELDIYEQLDLRESKQLTITPKGFTEFKPGDFVVHKAHGIGKYIGIVSENIEGIKKDYFLIEYLNKDKLYVPTWQAERIHKYIGESDPAISSLNSKQWDNLKTRVRKSVKVLAINLAKLYAERELIDGFAFSPDGPWQKEIEDLFPFNETTDQLKAIEYVKEKMQQPKPMDILVCGDVGFGKTEVAIRAAFKAIENNKQVLMLVPTTILADQHYNTFSNRFKNYPINVEVLSRFKSRSKQKEIVNDFNLGKVDMLIGTHRILQGDVIGRNLGLLIIDEEQRFGVNAKEKLKLLRKEIDVLTLTATPIPRTLYMSLTGIKDMILIETYPENRHPIKTFVGRKNNLVIKMAIEREIEREGQIYYVSSRVMGIEHIAFELKKIVPQAKIAITHGRVEGKEVEKIMQDFINKKYDILLTTSIIESGMDIPNVNTLIVENAHRFGLSQLYQLRGRVGRSSERAYAYFFYNERENLTFDALERLKTLDEYTELGSGYNIALRDLEIRGAGELLGASQHGHMNSVGFDLYCEIIKEEVERLKGVEPVEEMNVQIDLPLSAYIPKNYIRNENERINIYKNLSIAENIDFINELEKNIEERFGEIPVVLKNLINISRIKILLKLKKVEKISFIKNKGIVMKPIIIPSNKAFKLNKKNKNISYNFRDKSIIINNLNANINIEFLLGIIKDIIKII